MEYKKEYSLKNGKSLIVRNAVVSDSKMVADVSNIAHNETKFLGFSTNERSFTSEDEVSFIEKMNSSGSNSILLVAEIDGGIVGTSQITPKSKYKWKKHICDFGIAIIKKYWGLGIAGKLITSIIECAKKFGYEQIELMVVAENMKAFELYKSFGFELCGTIKNAYKFSEAHYSDGYMMQKFLK